MNRWCEPGQHGPCYARAWDSRHREHDSRRRPKVDPGRRGHCVVDVIESESPVGDAWVYAALRCSDACLSFSSSVFATGACCNTTTGACTIENVETVCLVYGLYFVGETCGTSSTCGACCDLGSSFPSGCFSSWTSQGGCATLGGTYVDGFPCSTTEACPTPPVVPAVSEWGMASVVLLLLTGLTIKFGAMRFRKAV